MNEEEAVDRIIDFARKNDNFTVLYHLDTDGIVSAALLTKALEKLGKKVVAYRPSNYEDFDTMDLSEYTDDIFICDMQLREKYFGMFGGKRLCLIDHHELIDPDGFVYINPKMWGDTTYTPASFLVYRIFRMFIEKYDWLSAVGLVGDSGGKENSEFVKKTAERYDVKLGKDEYMYDNSFGDAASMVGAMTNVYGRSGAEEALGIAIMCESLASLLSNNTLVTVNNIVNDELRKLNEEFEAKKEKYGIIYFFEMDPKYKRYGSTLVTTLSFRPDYYGNILVFMTKINHKLMRLNIRANGVEIRLPDVLREIFKKIKGEGGGHNKASGGSINLKDREEFKKLFILEVNKQLESS